MITNIQLFGIPRLHKKLVDKFYEERTELIKQEIHIIPNSPYSVTVEYQILSELATKLHFYGGYDTLMSKLILDSDEQFKTFYDKKQIDELVDQHFNFNSKQYRVDEFYVFMADPSWFGPVRPMVFVFVLLKQVIYTTDRSELSVIPLDDTDIWLQRTAVGNKLIPSSPEFRTIKEGTDEFNDAFIVVRKVDV